MRILEIGVKSCFSSIPILSANKYGYLKDIGKDASFKCSELEMMLLEVENVEKWKERFQNIVRTFSNDSSSLVRVIEKVIYPLFTFLMHPTL